MGQLLWFCLDRVASTFLIEGVSRV